MLCVIFLTLPGDNFEGTLAVTLRVPWGNFESNLGVTLGVLWNYFGHNLKVFFWGGVNLSHFEDTLELFRR